MKSLGIEVLTACAASTIFVNKINTLVEDVKRINLVPVGHANRARLIASRVSPAFLFAALYLFARGQKLQRLRTAVKEAVFGTKRQLAKPEIIFTLLHKGHAIDPYQAVPYRIICGLCDSLRSGW